MNKCKYCGIESETAYCTPSHKAMYFRLKRVTPEPVTPPDVTPTGVTPSTQDLSQCQHVLQAVHNTVNTGAWLPASQLPAGTVNRVSLPGDADYQGCCNV